METDHTPSCRWSSGIRVGLSVLVLLFVVSGCAHRSSRIPWYVSETRHAIVRSALALQGKVYRSGAKGPDAFDCSGFVHYVYKRSGITMPVTADALNKTGVEVSKEDTLPGDLVFFRIKQTLHVGIVLNDNEFIHASSSRGVVIDVFSLPYWTRSLTEFRSTL